MKLNPWQSSSLGWPWPAPCQTTPFPPSSPLPSTGNVAFLLPTSRLLYPQTDYRLYSTVLRPKCSESAHPVCGGSTEEGKGKKGRLCIGLVDRHDLRRPSCPVIKCLTYLLTSCKDDVCHSEQIIILSKFFVISCLVINDTHLRLWS